LLLLAVALIDGLTPMIVPRAIAAQGTSAFVVAVGAEQAAQKNPAESPYVYAGWGWRLSLGYGRSSHQSTTDFSLAGGAGSVHSETARGAATRATLVIAGRHLRATPIRLAGASWLVGAQLGWTTEMTTHHYAGPIDFRDQFGYAALQLGPAVRASFNVKSARITNELSAPLLNAVDFPYANLKMNGPLHLRFATVNDLLAFDDAITFRSGASSVWWTYRLTWLRYDRHDTRTFARHSLSMAVNFPRGRGAP
jgi:hypothetical protein